jgi:porin
VNDVLFFPLTDEIDEDLPIAITELRYVQFLSRYFGLFAGKFVTLGGDANEFAGGRGDTQFMSHTFLGASVTALINPYSTLGGGVIINPTERISFTSSVYSATDSSTATGFGDLGNGWISSSTLRGQYRIGDLPGGMLGTFQYGFDNDYVDFQGEFIAPSDVTLPRKDDSWNVFWNGWQYLYVEKASEVLIDVTDGRTDLQGVGIFARAGTADEDTNPVRWVVSGGLGGKGVIPGRDRDTLGIGCGYSKIRSAPFVTGRVIEDSAARCETYYTLSLMRSVEITFDAQWADSILERKDPSWLVGGRLRLAL